MKQWASVKSPVWLASTVAPATGSHRTSGFTAAVPYAQGFVHENHRDQDSVKMPPDSMRLVVTSGPTFRNPTNLSVSVLLLISRNLRL